MGHCNVQQHMLAAAAQVIAQACPNSTAYANTQPLFHASKSLLLSQLQKRHLVRPLLRLCNIVAKGCDAQHPAAGSHQLAIGACLRARMKHLQSKSHSMYTGIEVGSRYDKLATQC